MSYRDDHDALHERVEELERDLGRARQELDENRAERAKVQRLEKELAQARAKIERLQPRDTGDGAAAARRRLPLVIGAAFAMVITGAVGFLLTRSSRNERVAVATKPAEDRALAEAKRAAARVREAEVALRAAQDEQRGPLQQWVDQRPKVAPSAARARTATARWGASVREIRGRPLAAGARCTLVARLELKGTRAEADRLEIRCGGHVLYSSADDLGAGQELFEASAQPAGDGGRYRLKYTDQGARTGPRAQASVNTAARVAEVWSDNAPRLRAVLRVDEASAPVVFGQEAEQ